MFKTRVISGIFLILIAGISLYFGGAVLALILAAISLIGYYELSKVIGLHGKKGIPGCLETIGYISVVAYYILVYLGLSERFFTVWLILSLLIMAAAYVFTFPKYEAGLLMGAFFSVIYAPVMFSFIYLIRNRENGFWLVWFVFIASWVSDTCAYCVGMLLGKHKLAPVLSPKKSIEGAVGGVVGSALIGFLYAKGLQIFLPAAGLGSEILWAYPLISAIGAVLSQAGDLAASGIKRDHDLKDYSHLIPGHGGIMDRFDSVIVTAPLIYYLSLLLLDL